MTLLALVASNPEPKEKVRDLKDSWQIVKHLLRAELGDDVFSSWFGRLDLDAVDGDTVRMSVPTRFLKSWINSHYVEHVLGCWRTELPNVRRIELVVRTAVLRDATIKPKPVEPAKAPQQADPPKRATMPPAQAVHETLGGSPLDPRHTFDSFAVGASNTLARTVLEQAALAPRGEQPVYNPIYVHAGAGLGKTHLLQSVVWTGNEVPGRKVLYLTAGKFEQNFVPSAHAGDQVSLRDALKEVRMLVIDDFQQMNARPLVTFALILSMFLNSGRQVVLGADQSPGDLGCADERSRSLLIGGLVIEIGPMEESVRHEILRGRITQAQEHHPEFRVPSEVASFVVKTIMPNGRALDGALKKMLAHNRLTGSPVTMDMAERAVRELTRPQEPRRLKIEDIQRVVCRQYNISRSDMLSSLRTAVIVRPRQIAMYLAKTLTHRSLPEIGRRFGGRDHTTVLHATRKIERLVDSDAVLADEIELLKRLLQE